MRSTRAAARRARELGATVDPVERYRELEAVLTAARRRGQGGGTAAR